MPFNGEGGIQVEGVILVPFYGEGLNRWQGLWVVWRGWLVGKYVVPLVPFDGQGLWGWWKLGLLWRRWQSPIPGDIPCRKLQWDVNRNVDGHLHRPVDEHRSVHPNRSVYGYWPVNQHGPVDVHYPIDWHWSVHWHGHLHWKGHRPIYNHRWCGPVTAIQGGVALDSVRGRLEVCSGACCGAAGGLSQGRCTQCCGSGGESGPTACHVQQFLHVHFLSVHFHTLAVFDPTLLGARSPFTFGALLWDGP